MQTKPSLFKSLLETALVIALGVGIGCVTYVFIQLLESIASLQTFFNSGFPYHLILIPLVLLLIAFVKRNTLYFPAKVSDLTIEKSSSFWTPFMSLFHYVGTLLGHLAGVSTGREGAVVLFSAGLVRVFRGTWLFWGPIASSIGFSAIVGHFWIGPVFMFELFGRTSFIQKSYSLLGSLMAVMVLQLLGHHVWTASDVAWPSDMGWFKKALLLFLLGAAFGYVMRFYKQLYFYFVNYFKNKSLLLKVSLAVLMAIFLYLPEFRQFQSLGLAQFADLHLVPASFFNAVCKLFLTLLSTSLGFLGGEFIPLLYAGAHLGAAFSASLGLSTYLGAALGVYLLFAGGTRFKWSSYLLIVGLLGWSWWFWAYYLVMISVSFSGPLSLYKKNTL